MRIVAAILLLAVVGFCVFGFMATFEPLDRSTQLFWRTAYGVVGVVCLAAAVWTLRPRKQK